MSYPRDALNDNEEIIFDEHPHWTYMLSGVFLFIFTIVITLVAAQFHRKAAYIGIPLLALTIVGSAGRYLRWQTTEYVLTTDRLIVRSGIFSKFGKEIPLDRIMNISFSQSFGERILRTGDLMVESAGEQSQQVFADVGHPARMQNQIYRAVDALADEARGYGMNRADGLGETMQQRAVRQQTPPQRSPQRPPRPRRASDERRAPGLRLSIADEINKLASLRDRGHITDAEFDAAKRDLMEKY